MDDLTMMVRMATGSSLQSTNCALGNPNRDAFITVEEIVAAVRDARAGCTPPQATTTPTATRPPSATPYSTRLPTNTPTQVIPVSVCGGAVWSVPKVCFLSFSPNPTGGFAFYLKPVVTFRAGVSDLEGDISALCYGEAPVPLVPQIEVCLPVPPATSQVNSFYEAEVNIGTHRAWTYTFVVELHDQAGHVSNKISSTLEVY